VAIGRPVGGTWAATGMASKKAEKSDVTEDPRGQVSAIEERRRRKEEATTVDGSETFPVEPPKEPVEAAKDRGALGV
jgi:hypothetical protein